MGIRIIVGDCRERLRDLPAESVHCCVTSPPYFGLRDYGVDGQIGLEQTPDEYVAKLIEVFREVRRVLRDDGTLWLNLGDSYAGGAIGRNDQKKYSTKKYRKGQQSGSVLGYYRRRKTVPGLKSKDLIGIPWRVAFALQADGWCLRQDIIWHKPNVMPESVRDRCTIAHEYIFLLSKSQRYYFDSDAIQEPATRRDPGNRPRETRNRRSVWTVATKPFSGLHFAPFPPSLIEPCILAGCPKGGTVLDPFGGSGTTGLVADRLGRHAILIDLNTIYAEMARARISGDAPLFADVAA